MQTFTDKYKIIKHSFFVLQLVTKCDVLVENFLPKTMVKLGLSYDHLKTINPRLIFCSISGEVTKLNGLVVIFENNNYDCLGYGPDGPSAHRGGFDVVAAALGGFLHITGPLVLLVT